MTVRTLGLGRRKPAGPVGSEARPTPAPEGGHGDDHEGERQAAAAPSGGPPAHVTAGIGLPEPDAAKQAPAVEVSGLTVRFRGRSGGHDVLALDGVSLTVRQREVVVVVGTSGCGKTTLLRSIAGLAEPISGEIRVDGKIVKKPGVDRGVVFQDPSLLPWRTVLANMLYGLELHGGIPSEEMRKRGEELLELMELKFFAKNFPHELSGGMQQRVNLARALAVRPKVLLLDEPFSALDAQTRERMQAELLRIVAKAKTSALFITHDIDEAVFLADRVVVLSARPGQVKEVIEVVMPGPRNRAVRVTREFRSQVDRIWNLLE